MWITPDINLLMFLLCLQTLGKYPNGSRVKVIASGRFEGKEGTLVDHDKKAGTYSVYLDGRMATEDLTEDKFEILKMSIPRVLFFISILPQTVGGVVNYVILADYSINQPT